MKKFNNLWAWDCKFDQSRLNLSFCIQEKYQNLKKRHFFTIVHREEAARDIVDAEREYCTQIWSLVDNFMNPLREEEIVSLRECHLLFPAYIPLIYEQHCIMLRKLEERMRKWKFSGVIGDIFAKLTDSQDVNINIPFKNSIMYQLFAC